MSYTSYGVLFSGVRARLKFFAFGDPRRGHPFAQTSGVDKRLGKLFQLQIQQIITLMYQTDHDVGAGPGAAVFEIIPISLI